MRDPNKNKIAGKNLCVSPVFIMEILGIPEDTVPENTKKFSKVRRDSLTFDFQAVSFQGMALAITNLISLSKNDCQVALHLALAEINTVGLIGRSINCCSVRHFHKYTGEFI